VLRIAKIRAAYAIFVFFLSSILPAAALAQTRPPDNPSRVPAIKVRTQLVLIPATVTDAKGNRVTNLTKEDFAVFENDKRQEIALFEHVVTKPELTKFTPPTPGVFTNTLEQASGRISIFVIDLLNSRIEEQQEARKQILNFLSNSLGEQEPVCLVAVNSKGAWLIHGFTTDPKVLLEALNNVKQEPTEMDRPPNNPEEEVYRMVHGWHTKNGGADAAMEESRLRMLQSSIDFQDVGAGERIRLTLLSLLEIADAFVGIPGRKSMIWATAGFPLLVNDSTAFERGHALQSLGDQGLIPLYEEAWRRLEAANIAVYPLDVSELMNPGYVSAGIGRHMPQYMMLGTHRENLENLAEMTGGRFCDRSINAKKCFEEAATDSSDYYLLGIYDKSGVEKPGWRKLSVRSPKSELKIRARSGYFVSAKQEPVAEKKLMEMALFSPFDYTGLPLSVRVTGTATGTKPETKMVRFEYTITAGTVRLNPDDGNQLKLEFGAAARDASGKMVGSFTKVVDGKLSVHQAQQVNEKGVVFKGEMELGPGDYAVSFAVMDQVNENTGSVSAPLKVE
jgi:VWFA-related protein